MDMPKNLFKQKLRQGQWQVGLFVGLASGYSMEILAGAGFDWLVIDAEHSPNNPASVLAQLQAAAAYPVQVLVRPMSHDPALIKQYLDAGAQTCCCPWSTTPPRRGNWCAPCAIRPRASAASPLRWRARRTGTASRTTSNMPTSRSAWWYRWKRGRGWKISMRILAVEGVDAVFIGPADLAASLGHLGEAGHPEVRAAIEDALRRIAATGKAAGVFVTDPTLAAHYRDCGASFIAVGGDTTLLRGAAVQLAAAFAATLTESKSALAVRRVSGLYRPAVRCGRIRLRNIESKP
jgi:4-hydroxy-2-oxoheptanedioate aldolase